MVLVENTTLTTARTDLHTENPQLTTVSAMWIKFYKSHAHVGKIFDIKIDLRCGILNLQHVNFDCGFCATLLQIFPSNLNRVVNLQ